MNYENPTFILAGNGSYENRGCEAIIRGTVKILRECFHDPKFICLSHFESDEQYRKQCLFETDRRIVHIASHRFSRKKAIKTFWKPKTWSAVYQNFFDCDALYVRTYTDMLPFISETAAVLSVGGDNYSLDYGVPHLFTALDDLVLQRGKPIILWGASVGPFHTMPNYEQYMIKHLKKVTGIFARESATINYLKQLGINENVYPVADPAFLMDSEQPKEDIYIEEGAIGLNFSPLMAKFITGGDLEQWTSMVQGIITEVAIRTERPVYLIPHVTNLGSNDYVFMHNVLSLMGEKNENITLLSPRYTAAETKWIIGQMTLFAGTRTHSTIAAISSGVPTLSFAYSIKAQGINRDIFGHTDYCIDLKDMETKGVTKRITSMLDQDDSIRGILRDRIPVVQMLARNAGMKLIQIIKEY